MYLFEVQDGEVVTRRYWESRKLAVAKIDGKYYYQNFENTTQVDKPLRKESSAYGHNDFYIIKEKTMAMAKYSEVTVAVQEGDTIITTHNNEVDAYEYIQTRLELNPKARFKMFQAYQAIEPKRVDIMGMIRKLVN